MTQANTLRQNFRNLTDEEIIKALESIYTSNPNYNDLEFLSEFPGLDFLKDWVKTDFDETLLDQAKISKGARKLIKLALYEQGVLHR